VGNPFVITGILYPETSIDALSFKIKNDSFYVKRMRPEYVDGFLDKISFELISENSKKAFLEWRGEEILLLSIFRIKNKVLEREIELIKTVSLPFRLANILLLSGREPIDERRIFVASSIIKLRSPYELLSRHLIQNIGRNILEKIIHPIYLNTSNLNEIKRGLQEISDRKIVYLRLATYLLHLLRLAISVSNRIEKELWNKLSSEQRETILREIASLYWLEKPILRTDPICPSQEEFLDIVADVWKVFEYIPEKDDKSALHATMKNLEEKINASELILNLRK